jgi:hypothetical protein
VKYRKRPIEVEAEQWTPDKTVAGVLWEPASYSPVRAPGDIAITHPARAYVVPANGQRVYLEAGDWVITEDDGVHHYACKPEIFDRPTKKRETAATQPAGRDSNPRLATGQGRKPPLPLRMLPTGAEHFRRANSKRCGQCRTGGGE